MKGLFCTNDLIFKTCIISCNQSCILCNDGEELFGNLSQFEDLSEHLLYITNTCLDIYLHSYSLCNFCDNMSTIIHHKNNLTFHESTKHIKAHCNLIKNKLEDDLVKLLSIFSSFQFTDIYPINLLIRKQSK